MDEVKLHGSTQLEIFYNTFQIIVIINVGPPVYK